MRTVMHVTYSCFLFMCACGVCWSANATEPVEVKLCDLYQYPEQYTGKMIKVRAGSVGSLTIENILHDAPSEPCPAYMRMVVELPDQVVPAPGFQLVQDTSYKKLVEAMNSAGLIRIDATFEGRFDAAFSWRDQKRIKVGNCQLKGYGKRHQYDGRIVLRQVFDVWSMPVPSK